MLEFIFFILSIAAAFSDSDSPADAADYDSPAYIYGSDSEAPGYYSTDGSEPFADMYKNLPVVTDDHKLVYLE